jgi:Flp pilus assembly protein TadD
VRGYNFEGTEKDETYYLLLNNWAYSLATRGLRLDDALAMSAEACEHDPANGSYLDTRAWVLHMLDRNGEALEFARAALRLRQDSPVLYEHLGDILHALNQRNEARSAWSRSLELQPGNKRIIEFLQQYPATDDH